MICINLSTYIHTRRCRQLETVEALGWTALGLSAIAILAGCCAYHSHRRVVRTSPFLLPPFFPSSSLPSFRLYSEQAPDPEWIHAAHWKPPRSCIIAVPIRTALPYRSQLYQFYLSITFPSSESRAKPTLFTSPRNHRIEDWCYPFRSFASQTSFICSLLVLYIANDSLKCQGMFLEFWCSPVRGERKCTGPIDYTDQEPKRERLTILTPRAI
jgi:hypothetical protein